MALLLLLSMPLAMLGARTAALVQVARSPLPILYS